MEVAKQTTETAKPKYVIYTRVSTKKQGDQGISLAWQEDRCRKEVERLGGEIIGVFKDVESGFSETREGFLKALEEVASNEDSTLICATLDRLCRKASLAFRVIETKYHKTKKQIKVYFCDHPNYDIISFSVAAAVAQKFREDRSEAARQAAAWQKEEIRKYGYRITKAGKKITRLGNSDRYVDTGELAAAVKARFLAKFMADPQNKVMMRRIKRERAEGKSINKITEDLAADGYRTRTGNRIHPNRVRQLLARYGDLFNDEILAGK